MKFIFEKVNNQTIGFYESELLHLDEDPVAKEKCMEYCKTNILPYMTRKTINRNHTSYGLKHIVEDKIDRYVSNGVLKYCLAVLGVKGYQKIGDPNIYYPISEKYFR